MNIPDLLTELESLGDARVRTLNIQRGEDENQFGVKLGDLRKIAKKIKDPELGIVLWNTKQVEAMKIACLVLKPKDLSAKLLDKFVREARFGQLADWVNAYLVKGHAESNSMMLKWMDDKDSWARRAGWSLMTQRVSEKSVDVDPSALLTRLESEMPNAPYETQWTMNGVLAQIGINYPEHRARAIKIGHALGVFKDYPTPKGCTSPFAPIWIEEMVKRVP